MSRWDSPAVRREKAWRRERLHLLRAIIEGLSIDLGMNTDDMTVVWLRGPGFASMRIDLTHAIDAQEIYGWCLDEAYWRRCVKAIERSRRNSPSHWDAGWTTRWSTPSTNNRKRNKHGRKGVRR